MTSKAKHLLHVSKIPLVFQEMSLATLTFLIEDRQPDSKGIVSSYFTYSTFTEVSTLKENSFVIVVVDDFCLF